MGVRDALLHNTTGSNFESLQSGDTARIKGDFSVKNTSRTEIFGVDVSTSTVNVAGNITSTMNISGSETSTGSFGRVVASTFLGDGSTIRDSLPRTPGIVTASAQIAADISGAFDSGFFFGFEASSSISGGLGITGSFGRVEGNKFFGSGVGLRSTLPRNPGLITGSAQLASRISGSFNKGFEFTGTIKGAGGGPGAWTKGPAVPHNTSRTHVATGDSPNAIITVTGTAADTWNGSAWSEITAAPNPTSYGMAAGAYDATIIVGGNRSGSISWNGSNWTEEASTNRAMTVLAAGAGTTEATLVFGGLSETSDVNSSANAQANTEAYDGSSWSECNDMLIARGQGFQTGIGTQNSTISFGGCGVPGATVNPPSPYSAITFNDPRSQGDHLEEWNGTNWTYRGEYYAHPGTSYFIHSGAGVGTANASSFFGGYTRAYGGSGVNYSHYHWDGTAMSDGTSMLIPLSYNKGAGQGGAGGAHANVGGYTTSPHAAPSNNLPGYFQLYEPTVLHSGSFGRVEATTFHGDGKGLKNTLPRDTGLVTASAQIAADISGSFNKGFVFTTTSSLGHATGSLISAQVGAWSVGGNLNTGRNNHNSCTGAGVSSANAVSTFGGYVPASPNYTGKTENYDGTSWSEQGDLDEARSDGASFGTQNAGVYAGGTQGGSAPNNGTTFTEEFNGSSWSEVNAYPQAVYYAAAAGTQTAGLVAFGGQAPAPTPNGNRGGTYSVEYNGTNWVNASTAADFGPTHSAQVRHSMAGIQNAAITVGNGDSPSGGAPYIWCTVMNYDGSSWTIGTSTPNGNKWTSLAGTQNDVLSAGGYSWPQSPNQFHSTTFAQRFNGTAWSAISSMTNDQVAAGGAGLTSYQMTMFGGYTEGHPSWTGYVDDTQEYCEGIANLTVDRMKANHITGDGSFIKGFFPNMISSSIQISDSISGSFTSGFGFTGQISGSKISTGSFGRVDSDNLIGDASELTNIPLSTGTVSGSIQLASDISGSFNKGFEYTGNMKSAGGGPGAWSKGVAVPHNTSRTHVATGASPNAIITVSGTSGDTWNGSAWSEITSAPNPTSYGMATGDYDAALIVGGNRSGSISWNGSSWSAEGDTNRAMTVLAAGAGTTEAALVFGGNSGSADVSNSGEASAETEAYDGTSWSEVNDMLIPRAQGFQTGIGTQNSTISYGGCGALNSTVNRPSPYSDTITFNDPRSQGDHLEEWNGTNWTYRGEYYAHPGTSYFIHSGAGVGTANNASFYGGYTRAYGGSGVNYSHYHWDGTAFSDGVGMLIPLSYNKGAGQGGAGGAHANIGGYSTGANAAPGGANGNLAGYFQFYEPSLVHSGSFGRVEAIKYVGDGSNIRSTLGRSAGILSGSAQIAAAISGSILGGRGFHHILDGTVSGSIFSTGSFGLLKAKYLTGDGSFISSSILSSVAHITASSEIASGISASFTSGFELFSRETGAENQRKSYFVGVSGSQFFTASNDTTMSISSLCGSDFDYRLFDTVNQIKGTSYGTGVWSNATTMPVGARARAMAGTQNAFLSAGSYATNNTTTQKFNGSSWSVSAALNNTGRTATGVGTQNAMATFGGMNPGYTADDKSELYNGATWSNGNNMGTTRSAGGSAGTQNAAIIYGGIVNSPAIKRTETELYNGDVFTETADLSVGRGFGSSGGTQNDAIMAGGLGNPTGVTCTELWNGTSWTEVANLNTLRWNHTGIGTANHHVVVTGHAGSTGCSHVEEWNGDSWSEVSEMTTLRAFAGPAAGGLGSQGIYAGGYTYPAQTDEVGTTELWNATATTTGSFGLLKPRGGGITTEAFQVTSASLFKLPVFSDVELNYQAYEGEYNTGSLSGSVDRVAEVTVGQNLGEMWFDSDKNAIGYTYLSSSLISQSLSFGTFTNISASANISVDGNYVTSSQGFFTQSFYSHTVVTCYLTGSQI